ncbi:MAG: SAM-dependent DNA methyltransferase [Bacteroidota bacterium]|nr:MAG: SAM-dependent DNA methyltransferase [Bacteroidota bacterium]
MNQNILRFLKEYSFKVRDINRLLVSSFVALNGLKNIKNKLIQNYLISEDEEELKLLGSFLTLFKGVGLDIEELIKLFEFVVSPADKEVNGAVYTPKFIREYIVSETIHKFKKEKKEAEIIFGDIACGCGGFFITIANIVRRNTNKSFYEIYSKSVYGLDIQGYSVERTKILLSLLAISKGEDCETFEFNLFQGNALDFDWNKVRHVSQNNGFDIIVSNPPYVGSTKIDSESKHLLKNWSVSSSGKADLYIPFFQIGLENLNNIGILGYITVNTFIKSLNGRAIRKYFSENEFDLTIIDFGGEQLFKSRSTYTCICTIGKQQSPVIKYLNTNSGSINNIKKKDYIKIPYSKLDDFEGWYLNQDRINTLISKIENTGEPLGKKFEIRNGFATLKNDIYVFKPIRETEEFYFFEQDEKEIKVERGICKNAIKPNTLKSELEIVNHTEKLIFPYELIDENDLFDESKRLIKIFEEPYLKSQFPFAYQYLKSKQEILAQRDKGTREYEKWYAYGRNQALTIFGYKLLFPYISSSPCFVYTDDKNLLFYNGYAVISDSSEDLLILQKILMSKIFWFYIKHTSKPYSGDFFSLAKNYVKNFGLCSLSEQERLILTEMTIKTEIDNFLLEKYNIEEHEITL